MTPSTSPKGILRLDAVHYAVDGTDILQGLEVDVQVRRLGIVGRNGSGKSTLARLLAGLIAPSDGRVTLNGIDPHADRKAALREVGILFQNPDHQIIFPTVIEEVAFGLAQQGRSRAEAETMARDALAAFDKPHWENASVETLSQGQKHLLCLMSITAMAPNMLILDEPFAGLDIPTRLQLNRYLARYEGGLVHISHDPDDLAGYDTVLWLDKGRIVQTGAAGAILNSYTQAMTELGGQDDISDLPG